MPRKLRVFLCHASEDKPAVRELYKRLAAEPWIEPWLDEENLLPGQDFDLEIYKATRDADAIIICLSKASVVKEGYVNKEIRRAYDIANEKPEGAIYVIPLRLDECNPSFEYLKKLHWVDYFNLNAHEKLIKSLRLRAEALKIETTDKMVDVSEPESSDVDLDLYRFIQIPPTEEVPYSFYIGKYPVTNAQYERFLRVSDFANPVYWLEFPKFGESGKRIGDWGREGLDWLHKEMGKELKAERLKVLLPRYWSDKQLGFLKPNHPVVGISWYEANAYCEWLLQNWIVLSESKANLSLQPQAIRLPLETEWVLAAGGGEPERRYPWDEPGKETKSLKEILRRANVENGIGHTTPVNAYPLGKSPYGVMDMAGNVWENLANCDNSDNDHLSSRGGSWNLQSYAAQVLVRAGGVPSDANNNIGFRLAILPS